MVYLIGTVFESYLEAALWSTNDESTPSGGEPLDQNYGGGDLSPECRAKMLADCERFITLVESGGFDTSAITDEMLGHDFWLTRNHHGCGFWDRDLGPVGDLLTDLSQKFFSEVNLYVGDDGYIHHG